MAAVANGPTYHCQRCRLPLKLHDSLRDMSSAQLGLLLDTTDDRRDDWNGRRTVTAVQSGFGLEDSYNDLGYMTAAQGGFHPAESFVMLTNSLINQRREDNKDYEKKLVDGDSISSIMTTSENLFDVLSSKSNIDYPICSECAELLKEELAPKYEESCKERDLYISFLNKMKDQPGSGSEEVEELTKQIAALEKESKQALQELKNAENEHEIAMDEYKKAQEESLALKKEEEEFYCEQNKLMRKLTEAAKEKDRVDSLAQYHSEQLQRLQKINVYNDVFCIGHDGYFGTINGLRLGRLKDKAVEWPEINAAWGQTLLLVATVVNRLKIELTGYRLRPLGSMSRIEKIEIDSKTGQPGKPVILELYSSGDYSFERILNHKRLDSAMVAFLQVLKQVGEFVESCDSSLKLPYVIDKDKIGGYSIRLSLASSNESWTIACKYVLTNAKWILAYASSQ